MSVRIIRVLGITLGLLTGVATLLVSEQAAAQTDGASSAVETASYNGSYIRRPTLVVSDMEASLSLYRDILGFQLGTLKEDPKDSYGYTVFNIPRDEVVMFATLDSDVEKRTLALVEVKSLTPYSPEDGVRRAAFVINANGRLSEIIKMLEAGGYTVFPPYPLNETGTEVGFLDPDGHLVVIYEFNPS